MNRTHLPHEFVKRLKTIIPPSLFENVLATFSIPKPLCIRTNTLKTTSYQVKNYLEDNHISHSQANVPMAFILPSSTARDITGLEMYKRGEIFIQSLSSMIPAALLEPKPGEKILDMAAAPGSKTTQMAALMENGGEIIANDIGARVFKLKAVLSSQGVVNTKVTSMPGQALWKKYPEYFDKVLLDAPCSMEGMFYTGNPKTFNHWSVKKVKNLAKLQKWLLRSALSCVKVGGTIVYSTCTLSPEENEEVVQWLLVKEKGKVVCEEMKRIIPTPEMEGFFAAKLKKIAKNVSL